MHIDIEKLELSDVLVALVNAGATNTMTIQGKLPQLTHRIARELIQEGIEAEELYFDSILGRTLHIDLNDDVIDVSAYDKANGVGAALKALQAIGEVKVAHTPRFNNEMRSLKGTMEDRLSDRPDMLMGEAAMRRRVTAEQLVEAFAGSHKPTQADMDAWMVRFNNATPAERVGMIHDDSIKYAYPTKLDSYAIDPSSIELNAAALRMVGDQVVSVDMVAQSALTPSFEAEHVSNKASLVKQRVDELSDTGKETYYIKQLGRLDSLPTVDTRKK